MRFLAFIIIGMAFLAHGLSRPSPPFAPKAAFVELPPKAAEPARAPTPRLAPRPAASRGPLSLAPSIQGQQTTRTVPAGQAAPVPAPAQLNTKRTAEVLTVSAIAALIVAENQRACHATGRPCACPDDSMRNGRACGGRSAYSRPGGASPLC